MTFPQSKLGRIVQPSRLFLVVLAIIFAVEAAVMLVLPLLVPPGASYLHEAIIDACLLTSLLAPLLWWLVILPLRNLVATRTELLDRLLTAQEDERARIARDLHDGLGQSLTCLTVGLRAIEEASHDEPVREHARDLRQIGSETHNEVRRLASGLRPSVLDDIGLAAALERYFSDASKLNAIQSKLDLDGLQQLRLPRAVETALYRIVQEATTNAIRHGAATEIRLTVRLDPQHVELTIQDNGSGFDTRSVLKRQTGTGSLGLWSIRERVALLSGTVQINSHPGAGTVVVVRIPLPPAEPVDGQDSSAGR